MRLCVFCGSSFGNQPAYWQAARTTGEVLAREGVGLVYGGGKVGLMGAVADAALAAGGEVIGIMPRMLWDSEIGHAGLTRLHIVDTMHERKARMAELSDGFVALPGGAGTLEEIFEQWTWSQLGIHAKPCAFLNIAGYFDPLLEMIARMREQNFLKPAYADMLIVDEDIARLIVRIRGYVPPPPKWQAAATSV